MSNQNNSYYVPSGSYWPIVISAAIAMLFAGFANFLNDSSIGGYVAIFALGLIFFVMFGWFGDVIKESENNLYNAQVDRSFRMGMTWFIFSEVMFFSAFFGALFYARVFSVPWLDGSGNNFYTGSILWPDFKSVWPLISPPFPDNFTIPTGLVSAWGIPAINTVLLLTSGVTITWAHWALVKNDRNQLILALAITIILGVIFIGFQAAEYGHAYADLNLKLSSGIYGSTFYMLTGFHGFHVTLGVIMLTVLLMRIIRGHFKPKSHFAFEAIAWYWHFVDVVWLILFIFVYWI